MCLNKIMLFYLVAVGSVIATSTVTPVKKSKLEVLAETNRRNKLLLDTMVGLPWCPVPGNPDEANILPAVVHAEPIVGVAQLPPPLEPAAAAAPRRVYIRKGVELLKYGYSVGCPGCDAARSSTAARPHSEPCRLRLEQAMAADELGAARVAQAVARRGAPDGAAGDEAPPPKRRALEDAAMPQAAAGAAASSSAAAATSALSLVARELCALGARATAHDTHFDADRPQMDLHPSLLLDLRGGVNLGLELARDRAERTMKKMKPALT